MGASCTWTLRFADLPEASEDSPAEGAEGK